MKRPRIRIGDLFPFVLVTALLVTTPLLCRAQSQIDALPPAAALDWSDPGLAAARQEVARLEAEVSPWGQIDFTTTLDPLIRFRDYPADGGPGELSGRMGITATVEFGDPADTRARSLQSLERARRDVAVLELDGVTDALLAHAGLLIAQERAREAREDVDEAEQELAGAVDSELPELRLELRMAELDLEQALLELELARSESLDHGLAGSARYQTLRFVLPGPVIDPRSTHEYRMLELEQLEAQAELALAVRAPLDDLRFRTGYRTTGGGFEIEAGLVNGGPAASLGVDLPGGVHRWEVEVSAQLVLDRSGREVPRLEAAVRSAEAELAAYPTRFHAEFETALALARLAEEALDLSEEDLALRGEAARSDLYRAWTAYVRAVAEVLELSGGSWEVRSE